MPLFPPGSLAGAPGGRGHIGGSPIRGWPRWVRWTRIWWVRPVSSRHSISDAKGRASGSEPFRSRDSGCAPVLPPPRKHRHALAVEGAAADLAFDHAIAQRAGCPTPRHDRRARWCDWRIAWPGLPSPARSWPPPASPEVSLSRRWTMPGRASPPMPIRLFAAMGDQGIDQGAVGIARRGMHHQPRRLVDHDQVLVLVNHVERNILAARRGGNRVGDGDVVGLAPFDPVVGVFYRRPAACHRALVDQGPAAASG